MDDKQQKALESNFRAAGGSPQSSALGMQSRDDDGSVAAC